MGEDRSKLEAEIRESINKLVSRGYVAQWVHPETGEEFIQVTPLGLNYAAAMQRWEADPDEGVDK